MRRPRTFLPRGALPQRPRGPNPAGAKPPGSFRGGGTAGLQRKPAPGTPPGAPQRFSGQDSFQWTGSQRINVRVTLHRADPRQVKVKTNLHQEQKGEARSSRWDNNPCSAGAAAQKPPPPARIPEQSANAQSRYTPESASSILASFGLSNEDLEELSRYPDDQLTPENMPLILREIRIRKMGHSLSGLHPPSRGEETLGGTSGTAVKSKVIDYGHASKYGYTEDPLESRVYNPEAPAAESREDFQREQNVPMGVPPPGVPCNPVFPVQDLLKPPAFQNDSSTSRSFFPAEAAGKVSGLCAAPAGLPVVKPVSQPHVMPPMAQPPFSAELLAAVGQHERIQHEAGSSQPAAQSGSVAGQKPFQPQAEGPIKSPFGIVKASWLPVFLQSDAQKIKRLPTPSMMNDYYATSPRIFPHMCSLCNIECTHMKDWILHQNTPSHIESCRQLRQQYPDWNPESRSSKRNAGDRKENQTPKRRSNSASPSPRRSRVAGSSYVLRRSRSRSRSPGRFRPTRPRSRSPRQMRRLSPRHRSRSPQRSRNLLRTSPRPPRSSSNDWSRRATRSQGTANLKVVIVPAHGRELELDDPKGPSSSEELLNCGTVLQISDLPDDGFSDQDIKKIVQPFGKVSDLIVLRSRNEAYLEMNYKEAVIAAVKYGETVPVLVNGKRVKISVAEKPKASPGQVSSSEDLQISTEAEMDTGEAELSDPKSVTEADKVTEAVKVVETPTKGIDNPASLLGNSDTMIVEETTVILPFICLQEPDDICVVLISNLPEKGYSVEEVSNLAKPFGGLRDVLILSSHKKAYLEINRKSADSMVKFYTCFPMSLDGNQLCINMVPQYKTIKDEESIFTAIIKESDPKVNTEAIHHQFVHLGNLPDDGYREFEVVCVGLRFGKVDHYVVLKNKNKAILQLESPKAARSMYCFLKQYPYKMGEHTLSCMLSPNGEYAEVRFLLFQHSGLKKYPEGSGVVQTAAANPPVEPSVAKKEPISISHVKDEMSAVQIEPSESHLERAIREAAPRLAEAPVEKEEAELGVAPIDSADAELLGAKAEELLPPSSLEKEEALTDNTKLELGKPAVLSASEKEVKVRAEEVSAAATEPPGESCDVGKVEDVPSGSALKLPGEKKAGAVPEAVPPALDAASTEMVSPVVTQTNKKLDALDKNHVSDAVNTECEKPVTQITEKKPALQTGPEKKLEKSVTKVGASVENAEKNVNEKNEGSLSKAPQNKGTGPAKVDETCKALPANPSLSVKEASSVGKAILKAVVSLPDVSKARVPVRRNEPPLCKGEEQKAASKPEPRGQAVAEKKMAPKEGGAPRAGSNRASLGDGSGKPKVSRSSVVDGKGGNGRNSSQQDKDSRVESRASSKQSQEGESRSSSTKKDNSSNKASLGGNAARPSKSGSSSSEEELFPFNLDEFVTVDEVVEESESPVKTRRNPPRGKRKDGAKNNSSSEPSSKRRKGKSSAARIAESELSFVTLDEIGEEEDVAAQLAGVANLEVIEEEELMVEAVKDPQSLVTLDEISEQEELGSHKDVPGSVFEEQDLKTEPLVTVDEIGEVEELPLNEPTGLSIEDVLKQKEDDKGPAEDSGEFVTSQVPDDPSALVTVDEIQEDNEDNPLVTLDEVNEDEDDFLADFNRLKEELNFVTVDEVGEEDEEEENTFPGKNLNEDEDDEDIVAVAGPEEEIAAIAGPEEEDIVAVAGPEEMEILGDMSKNKTNLDYLVPKAGFFCQICSLFYADETSVKNHCKTPLHQQNMEKFMAKQKDEGNSGEERSSR
uniref:Zinc finger protein 638 n=1 Tax=Cairina moschata TaxID=8855 RepID=A0A8C3CMQ0_CAIMO